MTDIKISFISKTDIQNICELFVFRLDYGQFVCIRIIFLGFRVFSLRYCAPMWVGVRISWLLGVKVTKPGFSYIIFRLSAYFIIIKYIYLAQNRVMQLMR